MNNMKAIRLRKGLMQKDVALATGKSRAAISLYESGKSNPSMNSAFEIAQFLGVTVDELFGERGGVKC